MAGRFLADDGLGQMAVENQALLGNDSKRQFGRLHGGAAHFFNAQGSEKLAVML